MSQRADADVAVIAHTLLATMGQIQAALALVLDHRDDLDDQRVNDVLRRAKTRAADVGMVLAELVRGLPPEALELLDRQVTRRTERLAG